jgi:hypothetical protein
MSPTDGSRIILSSATKDGQLVQSTTSLVPSKRKVYDENQQPQESFNSTSLEGGSGYESFTFGTIALTVSAADILGILTKILIRPTLQF